ncbi:MAG: hypothetical protein ACKV2Q_15045 [Planctomycetaceae bacterium]
MARRKNQIQNGPSLFEVQERQHERRISSSASVAHSTLLSRRGYECAAYGYDLIWEITRIADGATLLLQGADAETFGRQLEATHAAWTDDDVCAEYDALFAPPENGGAA